MSNKVILKRNRTVQKLPFNLGVPIAPRRIEAVLAASSNNTEKIIDYNVENGGIEIVNDVAGTFLLIVTGTQRDDLMSIATNLKPTIKAYIWLFNTDDTSYARGEFSIGIDL